jgi:hypothetical protein
MDDTQLRDLQFERVFWFNLSQWLIHPATHPEWTDQKRNSYLSLSIMCEAACKRMIELNSRRMKRHADPDLWRKEFERVRAQASAACMGLFPLVYKN